MGRSMQGASRCVASTLGPQPNEQDLLRRQPRHTERFFSGPAPAPLVDVLGLSTAMADLPTCDLLVITASNGANLQLAERFATEARCQGQGTAVLDLTALLELH